jgi:fructose-1,6-bisphosphatase/inositol monophosphatase family enzyme
MTLSDGDIENVADLMKESATAELLSRFRRLQDGDIREKAPGDIVTVADVASEQRLASGLSKILRGAPVVGEEAVAAEAGLVAHIAEAEAAWIVDPLDGTSNFSKGIDRFAMIVALVRSGETVAGWIYEPVRGRMAIATLGGGALMDGQRIELPESGPLQKAHGFVGWKIKREVERNMRAGTKSQFGGLSTLACAGIEYLEILAGRAHFSLYRRTRAWDHAAGTLLLREAGGLANRHDGKPYHPTQPDSAGILTAPDEKRWVELYELLLGAPAPLLERGAP